MLKCFHFILSINRIWIHPLCIYLMIYVYIMIQLYIGCSLRCIYTDCAQQRVHCNQTAGCTMRGIDIYIHIIIQPYIYIYGIAQRNGWWDTKIDWVTGPSSPSGCQTFSTSRLACLFLPGLGQRDQFRKHGTVWVSSQTHKNQIKAHYSFTLLGWSRTCIYIYICCMLLPWPISHICNWRSHAYF